ncbi:hypothetical protein FDECE_2676 [Fusarium decemcellulare]|nr:hypothetical protein FDECE_2676 [Fusarium decemcellulare]
MLFSSVLKGVLRISTLPLRTTNYVAYLFRLYATSGSKACLEDLRDCLWWKVVTLADSSIKFVNRLPGASRLTHTPRTPQFILDTNHPWVYEHLELLEGLSSYDGLYNLGLNSDPVLGKVPEDLFKSLSIDGSKNESGLDGVFGWLNADSRLREILDCKTALDTCESFRISIERNPCRGSALGDLLWEPTSPPRHLPGLLADVLSSMTNLEKLEFISTSYQASTVQLFETEFRKRGLVLSTIKSLVLGPNTHFLIGMCPNLKSLDSCKGYPWYPRMLSEGSERHDFINATKTAPQLEEFGMHMRWNATDLEQLLENMPQIKTLRLNGMISRIDSHIYCYCEGLPLTKKKIKNIASTLGRFPNLTTLYLPQSFGTSPFQSGPAGSKFGPRSASGTQTRRRVTRLAMWMIDEVSKMIIAEAPNLKKLVIGNLSSILIYKGKVFWPWTEHMKEFLLTAWPRYQSRGQDDQDADDEDPDGPLFGKSLSDERGLKQDWRPKMARGVFWLSARGNVGPLYPNICGGSIIMGYLLLALPDDRYNSIDNCFLAMLGLRAASSRHTASTTSDDSTARRDSDSAAQSLSDPLPGNPSPGSSVAGTGPEPENTTTRGQWTRALEPFVLGMSDQQLITGMALMTATMLMVLGLHGLDESLSVYTFQVVTMLAYFSCIIHLCSLTVVRNHFDEHRYSGYFRAALMILFLGLLIYCMFLSESVTFRFNQDVSFKCAMQNFMLVDARRPDYKNVSDEIIIILNLLVLVSIILIGYYRRLNELFNPEMRKVVDTSSQPELWVWAWFFLSEHVDVGSIKPGFGQLVPIFLLVNPFLSAFAALSDSRSTPHRASTLPSETTGDEKPDWFTMSKVEVLLVALVYTSALTIWALMFADVIPGAWALSALLLSQLSKVGNQVDVKAQRRRDAAIYFPTFRLTVFLGAASKLYSKNPSMATDKGFEEQVYLAFKDIFKGARAEIRRSRAVLPVVVEYKKQTQVHALLQAHHCDKVCQTLCNLLADRIFQSEEKAKARFGTTDKQLVPSPAPAPTPAPTPPQLSSSTKSTLVEPECPKPDTTQEINAIAESLEAICNALEPPEPSTKQEADVMTEAQTTRVSPSEASSVASNFPELQVSLPLRIQHLVLSRIQSLLEYAAYRFAEDQMPATLERQQWEGPESVELNVWVPELRKHWGLLDSKTLKDPDDRLMSRALHSATRIRHTAVHRERVSVKQLQDLMDDAEGLCGVLECPDPTKAPALSRIKEIKDCAEAQLSELHSRRGEVTSELGKKLDDIAARRAELDALERKSIREARDKLDYHHSLACTAFEDVLLDQDMVWFCAGKFSSDEEEEEDDDGDDDGDDDSEEDEDAEDKVDAEQDPEPEKPPLRRRALDFLKGSVTWALLLRQGLQEVFIRVLCFVTSNEGIRKKIGLCH